MMFYNGFNLLIDIVLVYLAYEVGMFAQHLKTVEKARNGR
jgi:hypothetical protein